MWPVDRSPAGSGWPLVGRDAELKVLERTLRAGAGAVVAGAAGVGKSRLLFEAERMARTDDRWCRCSPATPRRFASGRSAVCTGIGYRSPTERGSTHARLLTTTSRCRCGRTAGR